VGVIQLYENAGSGLTLRVNQGYAFTSGNSYHVTMAAIGTTISVSINGVLQFSYSAASSNRNATGVGLWLGISGSTAPCSWDNFQVTALPRLWVQQDANWDVTAVADNTGAVAERYVYSPYGNVSAFDASWNLRNVSAYGWVYLYQGLRYDPALITYDARGRAYHPDLMRFLQNDPLGFAAGDADLYRAEGDSPTDRLDPSGLCDGEEGSFDLDAWQQRVIWGKYGLDIFSSRTFADALDANDQFFAGWSSKLTFGGTDWLREFMWGETATRNHSGAWYDAGQILGVVHQIAMLAVGGGSGLAAGVADFYGTATSSYFTFSSGINIAKGEGTWGDWTQLVLGTLGLSARGFSAFRTTPTTTPLEGTKAGVLANKAAGDAVRDMIAAREAPSLIEQPFKTVGGIRKTDVLKLGDELVGFESKVGRTRLDSRVRQELARDWWLLRERQLDRVVWEFSRSEVTGEVGPTPQLLEKLMKLGFDFRINFR
jgi:RHS repeat-associated protein